MNAKVVSLPPRAYQLVSWRNRDLRIGKSLPARLVADTIKRRDGDPLVHSGALLRSCSFSLIAQTKSEGERLPEHYSLRGVVRSQWDSGQARLSMRVRIELSMSSRAHWAAFRRYESQMHR